MINSLTILFSTFNGSHTLPRMFEGLQDLIIPQNISLDILVVDNNSSDNSVQIIQSFSEKLNIKILSEKRAGKNFALNKALEQDLGELVIITDDDIIPNPEWISNYIALAERYPDRDLFGGKVELLWESQPSKALIDNIPISIAFAKTPESLSTGPCNAMRIFGPNMAVRRCVFDRGIIFNTKIGPSGKNYIMGSESEFLVRAEQSGHKAAFDNENPVKHIVRPWQLTDEWLENRAFKAGRATIHSRLQKKLEVKRVATIAGYPRWCILKQASLTIQYRMASWLKNEAKKYNILWKLYSLKGYASEYKSIISKRPSSEP